MSSITDQPSASDAAPGARVAAEPSWSQISPAQWKSAAAAWMGWMFDGLDMHLYTLVATPFVAALMHAQTTDPAVSERSAWINAAFLLGWALGGGFFGRLGDLLGRSRTLSLTVFTYALFTGLSFFAGTWWQLLIFRFLSALGIGGEWAVGSSLLAETWPAKWRPWAAATLQTGVNIGVLIACAAVFILSWVIGPHFERFVFLVGIAPALLVFWIRRSVPEPGEWVEAKSRAEESGVGPARQGGIADLFRGSVRRTTVLTIIVCACSLTAWWAFMFWSTQHLRHLPDLAGWDKGQIDRLVSIGFFATIGISILGNYFAAALAKVMGYRKAIAVMNAGFFLAMYGAYRVPHPHVELLGWMGAVGFFSGVFGLFTMYLPPLFPTLLRTTGAGFSYNIGRVAAAVGTVYFLHYVPPGGRPGDFREALLMTSFLFIPAMLVALMLPELNDAEPVLEPTRTDRG